MADSGSADNLRPAFHPSLLALILPGLLVWGMIFAYGHHPMMVDGKMEVWGLRMPMPGRAPELALLICAWLAGAMLAWRGQVMTWSWRSPWLWGGLALGWQILANMGWGFVPNQGWIWLGERSAAFLLAVGISAAMARRGANQVHVWLCCLGMLGALILATDVLSRMQVGDRFRPEHTTTLGRYLGVALSPPFGLPNFTIGGGLPLLGACLGYLILRRKIPKDPLTIVTSLSLIAGVIAALITGMGGVPLSWVSDPATGERSSILTIFAKPMLLWPTLGLIVSTTILVFLELRKNTPSWRKWLVRLVVFHKAMWLYVVVVYLIVFEPHKLSKALSADPNFATIAMVIPTMAYTILFLSLPKKINLPLLVSGWIIGVGAQLLLVISMWLPHGLVHSIFYRIALWRSSFDAIVANPLIGYGPAGAMDPINGMPGYHAGWLAVPSFAEHAHNELLQVFLDGGLINAALIGAFLFTTLVPLIKMRDNPLCAGLLVGWSALAVHAIVESHLMQPGPIGSIAILTGVTWATIITLGPDKPEPLAEKTSSEGEETNEPSADVIQRWVPVPLTLILALFATMMIWHTMIETKARRGPAAIHKALGHQRFVNLNRSNTSAAALMNELHTLLKPLDEVTEKEFRDTASGGRFDLALQAVNGELLDLVTRVDDPMARILFQTINDPRSRRLADPEAVGRFQFFIRRVLLSDIITNVGPVDNLLVERIMMNLQLQHAARNNLYGNGGEEIAKLATKEGLALLDYQLERLPVTPGILRALDFHLFRSVTNKTTGERRSVPYNEVIPEERWLEFYTKRQEAHARTRELIRQVREDYGIYRPTLNRVERALDQADAKWTAEDHAELMGSLKPR